jgi:1,4-alpha-glucan branching enzyme
MRLYKRTLFYIVTACLSASFVQAQIVTLTPAFATQDDTITITYDATLGTAGLIGVSTVYAHTGLITDKSTAPNDWKFVQGNWGTDDAKVRMTNIGNNKHTLRYHIKTFYGLPSNETALKLAFVFRNVDGSKEGKGVGGTDIFVNLSQGGFRVKFDQPSSPQVITVTDTLIISASVSAVSQMNLYKNGVLYQNKTNDSLLTVGTSGATLGVGKHRFVIEAINGADSSYDTTYVVVRPSAPSIMVPPSTVKDGINYINDSTVILQLFAPGKSFVYVLGDFNNWEFDPAYYMYRDVPGTHFWTTITGLQKGKEYGFQYVINTEQLRVPDAYANKQLDPWNDGSIPAATYPNLKPYPAGKTTQIVSVLQTGQDSFNWQHSSNFIRPDKKKLVVYELLIRDFIAKHDYKTLKDTLGYLKRLGINAIELMPVTEYEGNESWGYNISFYFAPDKYYGPKEDLKAFIDECHKQDFAVIMDMVLNHSFGQSPMVRMYFDPNAGQYGQPTANNPWFNQTDKHPYGVGYDFNHEAQATQDFVDRVLEYWINEFKIDGYRFDLSKGFTQKNTLGDVGAWGNYDQSRINIWKRINNKVRSYDSSCYMILEHFADNSEEIVLSNEGLMLWGNINHSFNEATMGYASTSSLSWTDYKNRNWSQPNVMAYAESHDEERLMYKNIQFGNSNSSYSTKDTTIALKRMEAAMCFLIPLKGPKMIWQFEELGYDVSIDFNGRTGNKPIRWNYYNDMRRRKLYEVVSTLNHLKTTEDSLSTDNYQYNTTSGIKTFIINSGTYKASIAGNFNITATPVVISFPSTGTWYNIFRNDSIVVTSLQINDTLAPGEYRFYSNKYVPFTNPTPIKETEKGWTGVTVYPNPAENLFSVKTGLENNEFLQMEIWSITGRKIFTETYHHAPEFINLNAHQLGLENGLYIIKLNQSHSAKQLKLMIL